MCFMPPVQQADFTMYEMTTHSIRIQVSPTYLADESQPDAHRYLWSYSVAIENFGAEAVQLISRYWQITDANGHVQEVQGTGVIGEQPIIQPGDAFHYTSGTPLNTPSGIMAGAYQMQTESGDIFLADIPPFSLDIPNTQRVLN